MNPRRPDLRQLGPWRDAALLGLVTIGAYGVVQYAIGVLAPAIAGDTGWSTGTVAAAFSLALLLSGPMAVLSGYTLDRAGSRPVFVGALTSGAALLTAASWSGRPATFIALWGLGGAAIGGGLFYPVTMAVTARLYPRRRAAALSVLTLLGALASPLYYPLAGGVVGALGWRGGLRVLSASMVVLALPGALLVHAPGRPAPAHAPRGRRRVRAAVTGITRAGAPTHRLLVVLGIAAAGTNALMLHHVAAMQAAGLSLAAASGVAGARGLMQVPARVALGPVVRLLGSRGSMAAAYIAAALAALALWAALVFGAVWVMAVLFAIAGGAAVGLMSPLTGLLAAETYAEARLGTLSGVQQFVTSVCGAAGAWLAGVLADAGGGFAVTFAAIAVLQLAAAGALRWQSSAARDAEAPPEAS